MLQATIKKAGKSVTVTLKGTIDEASGKTLLDILPKLLDADLIFDCAAVGAINSVGFRQWIQFLRSLEGKSSFEFQNCPMSYVEYAGLLAETAYASRITSVLVPFRCLSCGREDNPSYELDAIDEKAGFGIAVCAACNGVLEPQLPATEFTRLRGARS
jgi:hypothetical protein